MTIKSLLGLDVATLEKMSQEELVEHCKPYLVEYVLDPEEEEVEGESGKPKREPKPKKCGSGGKVTPLELSSILARHGIAMPENLKKQP